MIARTDAVQQLGGTLGVALLGTVFFRSIEGASTPIAVSALDGAGRAFEIAATMVVVTGIATIVMVERGNVGHHLFGADIDRGCS